MAKKLSIVAYKDYSFNSKTGQFDVLVNPRHFSTNQVVNYNIDTAAGSPGVEPRFKNIPPQKCQLKVIFDSTGIIANPPPSLKGKTVDQQTSAFMNVVGQYKGNIHRPSPVELIWDKFKFKGVMVDLSITYNVFKPDGTPCRAEADASFVTGSTKEEILISAKNSSPDMSHVRMLKAGDTVQSMCEDIYGSENYFVQVAQSNNLNHLRGVRTGQSLVFPPLIQQ